MTGWDGVTLGWRDLVTGDDQVEVADRAAEFSEAVAAWVSHTPAAPVAAEIPDGVAVEPTVDPRSASQPTALIPASKLEVATGLREEEDLAARPAGALAREQAVALKQAAPIRTLLARTLGVHTEERAWRIGADGEEKVAAQLAKLAKKDPRWKLLHAVPVGENGSDIDHVVVGPGGVYTFNAKHHPRSRVWVGGDTFIVNGAKQPYIRNSRHEANRASRLLTAACGFPVFATGVVVPVGANSLTIKNPPTDVHVVNRMALIRWLTNRSQILDDQQIEAVFTGARRTDTWRYSR